MKAISTRQSCLSKDTACPARSSSRTTTAQWTRLFAKGAAIRLITAGTAFRACAGMNTRPSGRTAAPAVNNGLNLILPLLTNSREIPVLKGMATTHTIEQAYESIRKHITSVEKPTIFELGMFDGYHTHMLLSWCLTQPTYHGFEPDPRNVSKIIDSG